MDDRSQPVILTIEDDSAIRDSFHAYLEDLDYRVLAAPDGEAGLALFHREQPDLVLLDLRMPGMDGLDVLVRIHAQSPDTPVIIISGPDGSRTWSKRCGAAPTTFWSNPSKNCRSCSIPWSAASSVPV